MSFLRAPAPPPPPPLPEPPKPPPPALTAMSTIFKGGSMGLPGGKKAAGYDPTIATSGQGDLLPANTTKKTLIGQ